MRSSRAVLPHTAVPRAVHTSTSPCGRDLFLYANSFNSDLSLWDVSNVWPGSEMGGDDIAASHEYSWE